MKINEITEGYSYLPNIDRERSPERDGLEGPIMTRSGKVVYYDPKAGQHYDPDTDIYLTYDEFNALDNATGPKAESIGAPQREPEPIEDWEEDLIDPATGEYYDDLDESDSAEDLLKDKKWADERYIKRSNEWLAHAKENYSPVSIAYIKWVIANGHLVPNSESVFLSWTRAMKVPKSSASQVWGEVFKTKMSPVLLSKLSESINETIDAEGEIVELYAKLKDWRASALAGYARKVGVPDDVVDPIKRDEEDLLDEIMGHLFGDDWMIVLMNKGLV